MFASSLFADEADVRDFERQIEALMRGGQADEAAAIVAAALGELAREGQPLAALCLASRIDDIELEGWDRLAERIARLDEAGPAITAIGIDLGWPGHVGLERDAAGRLGPLLETSYYSDAGFPFSSSNRQALLDLPYVEDSRAQVDLNVVANGLGEIIEVQGTAEGAPMRRSELDQLVDLGLQGIKELVIAQENALREAGVYIDALLGR